MNTLRLRSTITSNSIEYGDRIFAQAHLLQSVLPSVAPSNSLVSLAFE